MREEKALQTHLDEKGHIIHELKLTKSSRFYTRVGKKLAEWFERKVKKKNPLALIYDGQKFSMTHKFHFGK